MSESEGTASLAVPVDSWLWQGHRIRWSRQGPQAPMAQKVPVVVLLHGFGASIGHWRHTVPALAGPFEVYALDLLGFGASDKPPSRLAGEPEREGSVRYCFDLWADQVSAFVAEVVRPGDRPLHLVGNSIGGLVALVAAERLAAAGSAVAQVILIDCAQRTLDVKRMVELPAWKRAGRPLLRLLVRQRWLLAPLFRLVSSRGLIRSVLLQAYPSGAHVDDELVELLRRPALEPGALESFRGFVNLFDDHLAPQVLERFTLPVRMLWGGADPWEDPAEARQWAERFPCVHELRVLEGLGHCPHDEGPERVNPILQAWIGTPP